MTPVSEQLEREVKLGVWPGFRLPDLDGVVDGVVAGAVTERDLEAVYYDTLDVRLARAGISLRHRSGDGTGWTLKLPDAPTGDDGTMTRAELTFEGGPETVPDEVRSLLTAWVRTAALVSVARLQTVRRSVDLLDVEARRVAEVVDDEVSVLDGDRLALRFREVEAEVTDLAPPGLLEAIVTRLRAAGAGPPDPTSKVKRALGPLASGPPDLEEPRLGPDPTAGDVVRAALVRSTARLLAHDLGVRRGEDPEAVHQARVATRRLRSDLRTFGDVLDPVWAGELRDELKGVAAALGEVRDTDVLLARLGRQVAELPREDIEAGDELLARLVEERAAARGRLLVVLDGPRYAELLERLVEAARQPRFTDDAWRSAADVLPRLVERPWRHLVRAVEQVEEDGPDEQLHEVRIQAKRARYAAEVAALTVGTPAARLAKAVEAVQEVLGDHQDAVVAAAWLRRAAEDAPAPAAFAAGQLVAAERAEAAASRAGWVSVWRAARKGKLRAWLK